MNTTDPGADQEIEPLPWGPALSCWFRSFHLVTLARTEIRDLRFELTCSSTVLSRTDTTSRLGFVVQVPERELHCCHPRRAVIAACQHVAHKYGGHVEARNTCGPFHSERLPYRYTYADAQDRVFVEMGRALKVQPIAQHKLFDLEQVFSPRSIDLPPRRTVAVVGRRDWDRFLLAERQLSRTSGALVVDSNGSVRAFARTLGEVLSIGGWVGMGAEEAGAVRELLYRRSWEAEYRPV